MGGATTVVEVIITDGAEATITVGDIITIGEIKFWKRPPLLSPVGTFRTWRDVRLESVMRAKAEVARGLNSFCAHQCYGGHRRRLLAIFENAPADLFRTGRSRRGTISPTRASRRLSGAATCLRKSNRCTQGRRSSPLTCLCSKVPQTCFLAASTPTQPGLHTGVHRVDHHLGHLPATNLQQP
jgi:hypothetical protein